MTRRWPVLRRRVEGKEWWSPCRSTGKKSSGGTGIPVIRKRHCKEILKKICLDLPAEILVRNESEVWTCVHTFWKSPRWFSMQPVSCRACCLAQSRRSISVGVSLFTFSLFPPLAACLIKSNPYHCTNVRSGFQNFNFAGWNYCFYFVLTMSENHWWVYSSFWNKISYL